MAPPLSPRCSFTPSRRVLDWSVTSVLKVLAMMSHHELPERVQDRLAFLAQRIDEAMSSDGHTVPEALHLHVAFDHGYVESTLLRALLSDSAMLACPPEMTVDQLGNGGCEVTDYEDGVERKFRFRRAERNSKGALVVRVSSDSILNGVHVERDPDLFNQEVPDTPPAVRQQWVLAWRLSPATQTLHEVWAGRVIGVTGDQPPFKLVLANLTKIAHEPGLPPTFLGSDDDLDLNDERETGEEEEGGASV
jgi:hypothetical protein